jgi:hypothetical protein
MSRNHFPKVGWHALQQLHQTELGLPKNGQRGRLEGLAGSRKRRKRREISHSAYELDDFWDEQSAMHGGKTKEMNFQFGTI